jgi:mannitol 2-dehydrogenase
VLPVIRQNLAAGRPVTLAATLVASWARYAEGIDDNGQPIEVVDGLHADITSRARRQHSESLSFVSNERIFGDLARRQAFAIPYARALGSLHRLGARQTLAQAVGLRG